MTHFPDSSTVQRTSRSLSRWHTSHGFSRTAPSRLARLAAFTSLLRSLRASRSESSGPSPAAVSSVHARCAAEERRASEPSLKRNRTLRLGTDNLPVASDAPTAIPSSPSRNESSALQSHASQMVTSMLAPHSSVCAVRLAHLSLAWSRRANSSGSRGERLHSIMGSQGVRPLSSPAPGTIKSLSH